jgi:ribosome-binding protein aMBF1 (putative translation factor)
VGEIITTEKGFYQHLENTMKKMSRSNKTKEMKMPSTNNSNLGNNNLGSITNFQETHLRKVSNTGNSDQQSLNQILSVIGSKIRLYRNSREMSQKDLADKSGLDRAYISSLESGKQNLTIGAMVKLAHALEVTLDELIKPIA